MATPEDQHDHKRMTDEELNAAIRDLQRLADKLLAERKAREDAQQRAQGES